MTDQLLDDDAVRRAQNLLITMDENHLWPGADIDPWTDAHGLLLLLALQRATRKDIYLEKARQVATRAHRGGFTDTLARRARAADDHPEVRRHRDRLLWAMALARLGADDDAWRQMALEIVQETFPRVLALTRDREAQAHPEARALPFVAAGVLADLDEPGLEAQRNQLQPALEAAARHPFEADDTTALVLWMAHLDRDAPWAEAQVRACTRSLDLMWNESDGCFGRSVSDPAGCRSDHNHLIAIALQVHGLWPTRVRRLLESLDGFRSGDQLDILPVTHVLRACAIYPSGHGRS